MVLKNSWVLQETRRGGKELKGVEVKQKKHFLQRSQERATHKEEGKEESGHYWKKLIETRRRFVHLTRNKGHVQYKRKNEKTA